MLFSSLSQLFFGYMCHWWQFARTKFWQVHGTRRLSTVNISNPALLFSSSWAQHLFSPNSRDLKALSCLHCIPAYWHAPVEKKQVEHAARFLELRHILGLLLEDLYQHQLGKVKLASGERNKVPWDLICKHRKTLALFWALFILYIRWLIHLLKM